jgi:hypothetical protein
MPRNLAGLVSAEGMSRHASSDLRFLLLRQTLTWIKTQYHVGYGPIVLKKSACGPRCIEPLD